MTKDLKVGYDGNECSLLDVCLSDKGPSAKIKLLNTFRDHRIAAKASPIAAEYDEWVSYNTIWIKR